MCTLFLISAIYLRIRQTLNVLTFFFKAQRKRPGNIIYQVSSFPPKSCPTYHSLESVIFLTNIIICSYLTLRIEYWYKALEKWMLRRDLNQQGGSDGGMKNMYCTLYKYYSKHKMKKDNLGEVCSMQDL